MLKVLAIFLSYIYYMFTQEMLLDNLTADNENHNYSKLSEENSSPMEQALLKRYRRHAKYVISKTTGCLTQVDFGSTQNEICLYVSNNQECLQQISVFNYLKFYLCFVGSNNKLESILITVLVAIFIVGMVGMALYIIAKFFIVPNVRTIRKNWNSLRFGNDGFLFGFVIIANRASFFQYIDQFNNCEVAKWKQNIILSITTGRLFIVFNLGLMLICFKRPFFDQPRRFLIHAIFNIALTCYNFWASSFILDIDIVSNRNDYLIWKKLLPFVPILAYICLVVPLVILEAKYKKSFLLKIGKPKKDYSGMDDDDVINWNNPRGENITRWQVYNSQFNAFEHLKHWPQVFVTLSVPIWIILSLLLPVVDEKRPLNGWCKDVFVFRMILLPVIVYHIISSWYLLVFFVFIGVFGAVLIVALTKWNRAPRYLGINAFFGLILAILLYQLIYVETYQMVTHVLTYFQCLQNNIRFLMAAPFQFILEEGVFIWVLLETHYSRIAYGYLLGTIAVLSASSLHDAVKPFCEGLEHRNMVSAQTKTVMIYFIMSYVLFFFISALINFEMRLSVGVLMLLYYFLYYFYLHCTENNIMHPYGVGHDLSETKKTDYIFYWS